MPSWVIVGASRGIGYQYLITLSRDPSNTVIGLVRDVEATKSKVESDKLGPSVHILHGDMDDASSFTTAAKETAALTNGVVDHLVVNGAYLSYPSASFNATDFVGQEELFLTELTTSMKTNVAGTLYAINAFLPLVRKSDIKKVINISSGHGEYNCVMRASLSEAVPYAASKAALNLLTAKYAAQLKDEGIKFLALSPGVVATQPMHILEVKQVFDALKPRFQKLDSKYDGPIPPEESVRLMLQVINNLTIEDTGKHLSQHGNATDWL